MNTGNNYTKLNLIIIGMVLVFGIGFWQYKNSFAAKTVQVLSAQTTPTPVAELNIYPNPTLTPGDIFTDVTSQQICVSGYTAQVRDVPVSLKRKVYKEYELTYPQTAGAYEADHFIPLELGGSNDIKNLWPEPANPTPGFHQKDLVENYLRKQVCDGKITLTEAQNKIRSDWLSVYNEMIPK